MTSCEKPLMKKGDHSIWQKNFYGSPLPHSSMLLPFQATDCSSWDGPALPCTDRGNQRKWRVQDGPGNGAARANRSNTSFAVSSIRVFGPCNLRVAFEASRVSRKRFETYALRRRLAQNALYSSRKACLKYNRTSSKTGAATRRAGTSAFRT
jgi:hypothetical protein